MTIEPKKKKKKRVIPTRPDGTVRVRPLSKARKIGTQSWTVRNVNTNAADKFVAYAKMKGMTTGEALTKLLKISNSRFEKQNKMSPNIESE
jgi:hypothetical protein